MRTDQQKYSLFTFIINLPRGLNGQHKNAQFTVTANGDVEKKKFDSDAKLKAFVPVAYIMQSKAFKATENEAKFFVIDVRCSFSTSIMALELKRTPL